MSETREPEMRVELFLTKHELGYLVQEIGEEIDNIDEDITDLRRISLNFESEIEETPGDDTDRNALIRSHNFLIRLYTKLRVVEIAQKEAL